MATPLSGVTLLTRQPRSDARGWLERLYCGPEFASLLGRRALCQINRTLTRKAGTMRGLHFQVPPHAETKIVTCLRGEVFDVAVDVRLGSPTFLHWHGEILSAENHRSLLIPEGFAHGFQTLGEDCEMLYLHTACYEPAAERGLNGRDPALAIRWPKAIAGTSARDEALPFVTDEFRGITL